MKPHPLYRRKRELLRALEHNLSELLGEPPPALRRYQREFEKDFTAARLARARRAHWPLLLREVTKADVVLVGDFHSYPRAQAWALKLFDALTTEPEGHRWALGLEMIQSRHQDALNRFAKGRLGEAQLAVAIDYHQEWGFPWTNYAPLLRSARRQGSPILALNRPQGAPSPLSLLRPIRSDRELHERDLWAAGIVADALEDGTADRAFILYGDLHLGSPHLTRRVSQVFRRHLKRRPHLVVIHQNLDELYWRLAARGEIPAPGSIYRLRPGEFVAFSGNPLSKIQSLIDWVEDPESGEDAH